jgi:hypothetical protein
MKDAWLKVLEVLVITFSRNAFYRALGISIPFALVMTLLVGGLEGDVDFKKDFPFFGVLPGQHRWIGIVFILITLLLTLVGFFSLLNARDDLLTPLRKKLVGVWEVRSQSWKIDQGKIAFGWVVSYCTISIGQLAGKLILQFDISNSDVFKDQKINVITTAFSLEGTETKLVYFFEAPLELKEPVGAPPNQITKLEFPFLGVLTIKFEDKQNVNFMTGHWYDINNGMYNLARRMDHLIGVDELHNAVENGAVTFGGALEFKRLHAPEGTPTAAE